jgi:hypothetical protein
MIGLEGSGFILSIGLTLLIAGTIVYYVNNKFKETTAQLQTVMQIVQQVNSTHSMPTQNMRPTQPLPKMTQHINNITIDSSDGLINVSDDDNDDENDSDNDDENDDDIDDDSDVSSTTDDCSVQNDFDEGDISVNNLHLNQESLMTDSVIDIVIDNVIDNDTDIVNDTDTVTDTITDTVTVTDIVTDTDTVKSIDIDTANGSELDSMLLNMIDIHKNSTESHNNLQDMKVSDLRELIKGKGIKVSNLGKLKKNECIELLS